MAFTPQNALDYAKRMVGRRPLDDAELKLRILNDASNMIHTAALWRWAVKSLSSITLTDGTIDYTISDPGDLLYLVKAELLDSTAKERQNLDIVSDLANETGITGPPKVVALTTATNVRVWPAPKYTSGEFPKLFINYKVQNTEITAGNIANATALLFPDEWHWVYNELVLYRAFVFVDDPRAGDAVVQSQGGQVSVQYRGQLGTAMAGLQLMVQKEKPLQVDLGVPVDG